MDEGLVINVELIDEKVQLKAVSEHHEEWPVIFDYTPPVGEGNGFLGLEMLIMSFAGCVSTAVAALLRRTGESFDGYHMKATGYRRDQPLALEKIDFEVSVTSDALTDEEMQNIMMYAEAISPVWLAIKGNVEVTSSYRIHRP